MAHNSCFVVTAEQAQKILLELLFSPLSGRELREQAMTLLNELPDYNWSGIYRLDGDLLILDAYVGAPTDHTEIPVGRGVCGTAVAENANQVIDDVRELSNYLACSLQTRSEIVVLIKAGDNILGQIDIDGHRVAAFDKTDEKLLQELSTLLAKRW